MHNSTIANYFSLKPNYLFFCISRKTPYSFVTFLSYFILNKNRHHPTTTIAWVVNINRTREGFRSLNLHLAEKHDMTRQRGVMLLVGDLSFEKQEFSATLFCQHWRLPFYVCCDFCGKKFHLKIEISNELIIDKLKEHIKVKHKVMILGGIPTELKMLNKDERLQKIEIMLLRNRFRTQGYNRYHAAVSDKKKKIDGAK